MSNENCDWKSKAFLKRNNINEFILNQTYKFYCRRTDKIGTPGGQVGNTKNIYQQSYVDFRGFATAKAFEVEDYMEQVEMWFRMYEMLHGTVKRKIYIATDEVKVGNL